MSYEPKNIVICLDGTGNQIEENLSNVLKLYRTLHKTEDQLVYYDQGVGTLKRVWLWGRMIQQMRKLLGMAFGAGLDQTVLGAYDFIVKHYHQASASGPYDRIYIFGFSRGAHAARVLSGLIYTIGILRPEQAHLAPAALSAYKQTDEARPRDVDEERYEGEGANFRRVAGPRYGAVNFLGMFDSVSSVFMPNPHGLLPPLVRECAPHTSHNPGVAAVRHAVSLDERRRLFRADPWPGGQDFKPNPHTPDPVGPQDAKTAWFPGYHSDVGGGHARKQSGLSQLPLIWMLTQAEAAGLGINTRMARYVTGVEKWSDSTKYVYPEPRADARIHPSMTAPWWIPELFPKRVDDRTWPTRKRLLGYYLPLAEPRTVPGEDEIAPGVRERMDKVPSYRPLQIQDRS